MQGRPMGHGGDGDGDGDGDVESGLIIIIRHPTSSLAQAGSVLLVLPKRGRSVADALWRFIKPKLRGEMKDIRRPIGRKWAQPPINPTYGKSQPALQNNGQQYAKSAPYPSQSRLSSSLPHERRKKVAGQPGLPALFRSSPASRLCFFTPNRTRYTHRREIITSVSSPSTFGSFTLASSVLSSHLSSRLTVQVHFLSCA
jgi:hypothetical protein